MLQLLQEGFQQARLHPMVHFMLYVLGATLVWTIGLTRAMRHMDAHDTISLDMISGDDKSALRSLRWHIAQRWTLSVLWPIYFLFFSWRRPNAKRESRPK